MHNSCRSANVAIRNGQHGALGIDDNSTENSALSFCTLSRDRRESNSLPQKINSGALANKPQSLMGKVQKEAADYHPNYNGWQPVIQIDIPP